MVWYEQYERREKGDSFIGLRVIFLIEFLKNITFILLLFIEVIQIIKMLHHKDLKYLKKYFFKTEYPKIPLEDFCVKKFH